METFINNSHPEPEERANGRRTRSPKPVDEELRARLMAHRDALEQTNAALAVELGYSSSVVSQYLADGGSIYTGDIQRLERRIQDYLANYARRRLIGVPLVESDQTRQVASAMETIRRTNDVGLIYGDAGIGKTTGITLYQAQNPTCFSITLVQAKRDQGSVEGMVFECVGRGDWKGNTKRWDYIVGRTRSSNRLLIVDNAHLATRTAMQWLFDFHDETGCPIALVGNEEVLRLVEGNDQRFSRIGLKFPVRMRKPKALLRHLIGTLAPDAADSLDCLSEQVCERQGRYRAVAKELSLARTIREGKPELPWADAFRAAHGMLVRNYRLEEVTP